MINKSITKTYQRVLTLALATFSFLISPLVFSFPINAYEVTDSFGKHRFDRPPQRIVVTDWTLLEQMLALGVEPIGAPELERYQHFVKQPSLPADIKDIGLRRSPKLQAIRDLKPDVIVIGTDQKSLARPFSHIAPVMYYKSFSDKYRTNGKKTRERLLQIADLFQKRPLAETKLARIDEELATIKSQIHQHFNGQPPKLTVIRFSSEAKCLIYGKNSIVQHTLKQLDLTPALDSSRTKWGEKEVYIKALNKVDSGLIVYILPVDQQAKIFSSNIWQSIPAVQENRVIAMQPAWSYGGAMSVLYNARSLRDALLGVNP